MLKKIVGLKLLSPLLRGFRSNDDRDLQSGVMLRLDAPLVEQLGWREGDSVEIVVDGARLVISRAEDQMQKYGVVAEQRPEDFLTIKPD